MVGPPNCCPQYVTDEDIFGFAIYFYLCQILLSGPKKNKTKKKTSNWLIVPPWENSESHNVVTNCCFKTIADYTHFVALQCTKIISEDPIFCCLLQHVWLGSISRESPHVTDLCARAVFPSHMIMKCETAWPMWCWGYLWRSLGRLGINRTEKNRGVKQKTLSQTKTWVVTKSDY